MQKQCIEDYYSPRNHPKAPDVKTAEEIVKGKYLMGFFSASPSLGTHLHLLSEPGCDLLVLLSTIPLMLWASLSWHQNIHD